MELAITSHPPKNFNPRLRHNQTSENYKHFTKLIVSSRCTFFIISVFSLKKSFSEKNTKVMEVVGQTECHDSLKWGCGGDSTSVRKLQTAIAPQPELGKLQGQSQNDGLTVMHNFYLLGVFAKPNDKREKHQNLDLDM